MNKTVLPLSLALATALLSLGCSASKTASGPGATPADRAAVDSDGIVRRGGRVSSEGKLSVAECTSKAASLDGKTVRVEGVVEGACEKKGCWFTLKGEAGSTMRVRFQDYKYFIPKDIPGRVARIEGRLEVKKLSRAQAQHYEDDAARAGGRAPNKVTSGRSELTLFATAVEIDPAKG